ncbi:hypothetical protein QJQ45_020564 [Haematococcus lacustris]|nr:hypothetical protein QJQ45_020564 [Haematococcus lacustris]
MDTQRNVLAGSMPPSLSEITPDLASLVASQLELDERAVGRLAITSKFWWTVCADQQLWRTLAARRFGLKAVQPEQTSFPVHCEGWTFVQGMRASGRAGAKLEDMPLAEVAAAAAADLAALAFHTDGSVLNSLDGPGKWQHTSFEPWVGTYVRSTWPNLPELLPTPSNPSIEGKGQCPPELQGWTFLPGLDLAETRALPCLVKDFRSLADLAHHCLNKHEVVAFTTKGHVAELPAVQWSFTLQAWHGVYVRSPVLAEGSLPPVPTWQQRFLHWARLRLPIVQQSVAWLDGNYLKRCHAEGALAPEVVRLDSVCWLGMDARWPAVAPGDYLLAWRVQFMRRPSFELTADLQLEGIRGPGEEVTSTLPTLSMKEIDRQVARPGRSAGQEVDFDPDSMISDNDYDDDDEDGDYDMATCMLDGKQPSVEPPLPASSPAQGLPLLRHFVLNELESIASAARPGGWAWLEVGRLHVPPGQSYALCARLWNISNAWKSGMMFDVVELKRVQGLEGKAAQGPGGELGLLAGGQYNLQPELQDVSAPERTKEDLRSTRTVQLKSKETRRQRRRRRRKMNQAVSTEAAPESRTQGVYVRSSALAEGSLSPVPTRQQRSGHKASLRLPVVQQCVAFLDAEWTQFWTRCRAEGALAPEVARMNRVGWLGLDARWPAVAPGDYLLAWRVQFMGKPSFEFTANIQLEGIRGPGEEVTSQLLVHNIKQMDEAVAHQARLAGLEVDSDADTMVSAKSPPACSLSERRPLLRHFTLRELESIASATRPGDWAWVEVGRLHVPPGHSYALCAQLWNISLTWKSGMMFDVVELKRVQGLEGKAAQGPGGELGLLAGGQYNLQPELQDGSAPAKTKEDPRSTRTVQLKSKQARRQQMMQAVSTEAAPGPKRCKDAIDKGLQLFSAGEYRAAIDYFNLALELPGSGAYRMAGSPREYSCPSDGEENACLYNMGCAWAKLGQKESALTCLEAVLDNGFEEYSTMAADPDLQALGPELQALIARYNGPVAKVSRTFAGLWGGKKEVVSDPNRKSWLYW